MSAGEFLAGVAILVALIVGIIIGHGATGGAWKEDAIKAGHAEYVLKGSEAVWQWKAVTK